MNPKNEWNYIHIPRAGSKIFAWTISDEILYGREAKGAWRTKNILFL